MKKIYTVLACLSLSFGVSAQTTNLGSPLGWNGKIEQKNIPTEVMPGYDQAAIDAEDFINDAGKDAPWRFGYKYDVNYSLSNSGNWTILPNGSKVWQLTIECAGAMTVNLLFEDFKLPTGAYLYLYDVDQTNRVGAYTARNNREDGDLGTELVHGEKIIVEYVEPANASFSGTFTISNVIHGYRSLNHIQSELTKDMMKALNSSGSCNIDVNCPLGDPWGDQIRSVAMIVVGGSGVCTGALINNTCDDGTPYFLTANHCLGAGGGPSNWAFRFNWETPLADVSCATAVNSTDPGPPYDQTANGATTLVSGTQADHALLQIDNMTVTDATNWLCYYAGWDNSDATTVTSAIGIHHPAGDVKKICEEQNAPYHQTAAGAAVWYIDEWEEGVTEPGSSGSPLFDQNGRIIGQLYGGLAACSGTSNNGEHDYYGRLGVSWPLGIGTYLAPAGPCTTGSPTTNDGWDPNSPSSPDDAAITAIIQPTGLLCSGTFVPEVTLKNEGTNNLTSVTINYDVDAGTNQIFNWVGNLAPGATENVILAGQTVASGAHNFNASTELPNGNVDSNSANDNGTGAFSTVSNGQSVTLDLNLDCYGNEISWVIEDVGSNIVLSGGPYAEEPLGELITVTTCLDPGCYDFIIDDSYGDGMYGSQYGGCSIDGDYTITQDLNSTVLATIIAANSDFGNQEINNFCVTPPCAGTAGVTTVDVSCFGNTDGSSNVTMTGGDAPFSYDIGSGAQASGSFTGLTAGIYTVTIIDNNACTNTIDLVINEPSQLEMNNNVIDETCPGSTDGSISITASGGTAPYSYSINCGGISQATQDFTGLSAATYNALLVDNNGCQVGCTPETVSTGSGVSATLNITNVSCNGDSDGSIQVVPTNGTAPFTYDIGSGAQASDTFTTLGTGSHTIDITDGFGCTGQIMGTVGEPAALTASEVVTDEIMGNDGEIDVTVNGGTAPYSYSWSGPNGFTSTNEDISGLESGNYTITITDANGCTFERAGIIVDSQLGTFENGFSFTIYPNPSNGIFNVQLLNFEDAVQVQILDVTGRLILDNQYEGQSLFTIDLSDKADGTYFVNLSSGDYKTTKKIVSRK